MWDGSLARVMRLSTLKNYVVSNFKLLWMRCRPRYHCRFELSFLLLLLVVASLYIQSSDCQRNNWMKNGTGNRSRGKRASETHKYRKNSMLQAITYIAINISYVAPNTHINISKWNNIDFINIISAGVYRSVTIVTFNSCDFNECAQLVCADQKPFEIFALFNCSYLASS